MAPSWAALALGSVSGVDGVVLMGFGRFYTGGNDIFRSSDDSSTAALLAIHNESRQPYIALQQPWAGLTDHDFLQTSPARFLRLLSAPLLIIER